MKKNSNTTKPSASTLAYNNLHAISREITHIESTSHLLDWDQETYMPPGAAAHRAEQLEALAGIAHQKKVGSSFKNALEKLISVKSGTLKAKDLPTRQQAAVRLWRKDFLREKCLPQSFTEKWAKLTSTAINAWKKAKTDNNFKLFLPLLTELVDLARKKADYLTYKNHPYDALMDLYEPELTVEKVTPLFTQLRKQIVPLLKSIKAAGPINDAFLNGTWSHELQLEFSKKILTNIGYDLQYGRIDLSSHPFCSGMHPTDTRVTTRFHPTNLISCVSTLLHEAGHALYSMGIPKEEHGSPLGEAVSMALHESQSRFWEIFIGQGRPFWSHYLPKLKATFPGKFDKVTLEQFYKAINKVTPSLIRVDADEVTYPLHVILRYDLERKLIEGSMKTKEIPDAWNAGMKELLGITPPNDQQGCLQDIHWAMGGFGYFPTYALGTMYAAQLFSSFAKKHKGWDKRVANGELLFIKEWLNKEIHQHGRQFTSFELIKRVTGKEFDAGAFTSYLKEKYL